MKLNSNQFRAWKQKAITLLGMSGVGKTRIARVLRRHHWFHYSCDYRIGTRYLDEDILDNIKQQAMQVPFLQELLQSDSIHIANNISVDNLKPLSTFLGKVGNPEYGGIGLAEFKRRQVLHRSAEIAAMYDVSKFIHKAHEIYGYDHFINDASGSLCELDDEKVMSVLSESTLILYIKSTTDNDKKLIKRAEVDPKPLYYREEFLDKHLAIYMEQHQLEYAALIEPDDFIRWVFLRLYNERLPRYEKVAEEYGYTVMTSEIEDIKDETGFIELIADVLAK